MEMLVQCTCGQQELVTSEDAESLHACHFCGALQKLPPLEAFRQYLELLQRSQHAFAEEAITPDLPPETLRELLQTVRFACVKQHICLQCAKIYDGFFSSNVPGHCPRCTETLARRVQQPETASLHLPLRTRGLSTADMDILNDEDVQRVIWSLSGVLIGFILGGIAAFSTKWF